MTGEVCFAEVKVLLEGIWRCRQNPKRGTFLRCLLKSSEMKSGATPVGWSNFYLRFQ